jgi:hypothetical protein
MAILIGVAVVVMAVGIPFSFILRRRGFAKLMRNRGIGRSVSEVESYVANWLSSPFGAPDTVRVH